jgi:hypothetical protein
MSSSSNVFQDILVAAEDPEHKFFLTHAATYAEHATDTELDSTAETTITKDVQAVPDTAVVSATDSSSSEEVAVATHTTSTDLPWFIVLLLSYIIFLLLALIYGKYTTDIQLSNDAKSTLEVTSVSNDSSLVIHKQLEQFIKHVNSNLTIQYSNLLVTSEHSITVQLVNSHDEKCLSWKHQVFGGRGIFTSCQLLRYCLSNHI